MKFLFFFFMLSLAAQAAELPPRAQELMNLKTIESGPNCWNNALYAAGLIDGIRFVDYEEFTAWLSSPFCQEVKEGQAGDVVALRRADSGGKLLETPFGFEVHGYYLADKGVAFTKNGVTQNEDYHLQDADTLFTQYQSTDRRNCRILGFPLGVCHLKAQYFRCQPKPVWAPELAGLASEISVIEKDLHLFYLGKSELSPEEEKSAVQGKADALLRKAAALEKKLPHELIWQLDLLELRLNSIETFYF